MTASEIPNGTERCNAAQLALSEQYDIVVNIQVSIAPSAPSLPSPLETWYAYSAAAAASAPHSGGDFDAPRLFNFDFAPDTIRSERTTIGLALQHARRKLRRRTSSSTARERRLCVPCSHEAPGFSLRLYFLLLLGGAARAQGDEPLLEPEIIDEVVEALQVCVPRVYERGQRNIHHDARSCALSRETTHASPVSPPAGMH